MLQLLDIVERQPDPAPWAEGEKIPWNEPGFSARMLREHLSQAHDAASRRLATIDRHVAWIDTELLHHRPTRILDLGCGPGLYTQRLAQQGHTCTGIDFSPASIAYAQAQADGMACHYRHEDLRHADYGANYGLVMLIFGELNVFRPAEATQILAQAYAALAPQGLLLLEPHTFGKIMAIGQQPPTWSSYRQGLFADTPHLYLHESRWNEAERVATQRYYIVDAAMGGVQAHASSMQAYSDDEYRQILAAQGFGQITFFPALGGGGDPDAGLIAIVARK